MTLSKNHSKSGPVKYAHLKTILLYILATGIGATVGYFGGVLTADLILSPSEHSIADANIPFPLWLPDKKDIAICYGIPIAGAFIGAIVSAITLWKTQK